jgi:hypothetical protein
MRYKNLIMTALGLGLVRLNLGCIGQDKLSLNNKEKCLCSVNRYNGSIIIITVHLNTQKYSKAENSQRNQSISLCNDSIQLIQRLFFLNRYNDSQTVITVHAENSFFSCFRRSILKGSPFSMIVCTRSI